MTNSFNARTSLNVGGRSYEIFSLASLPAAKVARLPYSLKILLENLLRLEDGVNVTRTDIEALLDWDPRATPSHEIAFTPARVIMQDFTGVPCVVDLAAMRDAIARLGGDPQRVNPLAPAELVIDHSVQVDEYGNPHALAQNTAIEFARNGERYSFLRWGQTAFRNFAVVPPSTGIVHQVNLEYLGRVIFDATVNGVQRAYPDTVVGTDSHTTMINGLGVLGWGVGGIEAEAAMLGQPVTMLIPQVIGFRLEGKLRPGATATDLVLTVTEMLRKKGVVDKFVEYFGDGLAGLPLADRATIANMAPEYGSTCGIFPIDEETLRYLTLSGRPAERIALVEAYAKHQTLWRSAGAAPAQYTDVLELDLATVEPSLAGPRRPQDRVALKSVKSVYRSNAEKTAAERAARMPGGGGSAPATLDGQNVELKDGAVLIAAITSCTNTSNPSVMLAAGLLARKARARGLKASPWVKTSLAPGSRVVTDYLDKAGLSADLAAVGFDLVGYGCTTCIAAGTPVLLANGTSSRIEGLPGGTRLYGPTRNVAGPGEVRLGSALATETLVQGARECVTLTFQDGRTLVCTPDHEILLDSGEWVRADELEAGSDCAAIGLEAPLDEPCGTEEGYELAAGELRFSFDNHGERARSLAFARLLGYLSGEPGAASIKAGHPLDREAVLNDIELITGERPAATRSPEGRWRITLPYVLAHAVTQLAGSDSLDQPLPAFLLEERCPIALVREYLGGAFGARGHAPALERPESSEGRAALLPPSYSRSAQPQHVKHLTRVMQSLSGLLVRCGVKAWGAEVLTCELTGGLLEVRLQMSEGLSFVERVGYRYSLDKSFRASAAAVYWRTIDTINRQRLFMADRVEELRQTAESYNYHEARNIAARDLRAEQALILPPASLVAGRGHYFRQPDGSFRLEAPRELGFPSPADLLDEIGAGSAGEFPEDALDLPTLALRVIDCRPAGRRDVYDLSVASLHAFVAAGVCVHNCIGNSGPLKPEISQAVKAGDLTAASVLSGNRNFEGRVHPEVRQNFLASPPLVVAYALAGTVDIDLTSEALGTGSDGKPVYLADLWPSDAEVQQALTASINSEMFRASYASVFAGDANWAAVKVPSGERYTWDDKSTYVRNPPYFEGMSMTPAAVSDIAGARALAVLGDSVTTDHISPAGNIAKSSPAARYLIEHGVQPSDFNSYGSRRGNHEVMMRGTFANIRLRNLLVPGVEGGLTVHLPDGERLSIYDAAMRYKKEGTPLIVLAGREYGTGSSRDWAAKGTMLLGVKAVLAESFERIHRSNLIGMGVAPLQFLPGQNVQSLGLTGREQFAITGLASGNAKEVTVTATPDGAAPIVFKARVRIDTPKERDYYQHGGILQYVLRQLAAAPRAP